MNTYTLFVNQNFTQGTYVARDPITSHYADLSVTTADVNVMLRAEIEKLRRVVERVEQAKREKFFPTPKCALDRLDDVDYRDDDL